MKNVMAALMVALLAAPPVLAQAGAPGQPGPGESASWRNVAISIPPGSRVKVETFEHRRYTGTLMHVTDTAVVIKRSTRLPEPPVTILFDQVARLEQDRGGTSIGKAIGIGVAAGAGAMMSLILLAIAIGGD